MRVIICGAGQVGYNIANYLSREDNEVTVIDVDAALIGQINDVMDVNGVVGHASNPDVLNAAGANNADMLIAVTMSDEINMVACQIGHSLFSIPKKIARIRQQSYLDPAWSNLFSRSHMPIDVIISPEQVIANDIYQRLSVPGTTFVNALANGKAHMVGVICGENCPVLNTPLEHLPNLFPDLSFKVICILRNNKPIIPEMSEQLEPGDEAYFVTDTDHLYRALAAFGHEEKQARSIIITGGGNIGLGLTRMLLERRRGLQIKMIEKNAARARYLSEQFEDIIILKGSGLDKDILEEASIDHVGTYIAVTNDDESNILGSLLAKHYGCERVITLVNNEVYTPLIGTLGIDAMVLPKATIVATIMQHVRRGRIKGLHNLRDGFAEVIEAEVSETASIANTSVATLELPADVIIAAIVRDGKVIMPDQETVIKPGDLVVILAAREQVQSVEKMFSVHVDIF